MADSLFQAINEFRLIDVDGVILNSPNAFILIYEPEGFGDAEIVLERNDRGGFDFEYGSDETRLGFDGTKSSALAAHLDETSGRYLIEAIYEQVGSDLNVKLEFRRNGDLFYEGFLIGSSYDQSDYATFFRVKRFDFGNRLKTRFKSIINVEDNQTLDGNSMTPLAMRDFVLHSQVVRLSNLDEWGNDIATSNPLDVLISVVSFNPNEVPVYYFLFGLFTQVNNNLRTYFKYPNTGITEENNVSINFNSSFDFSEIFESSPIDDRLFIFRNDTPFNSKTRFQINFEFEISTSKVSAGGANRESDVRIDLIIADVDGNIDQTLNLFTANGLLHRPFQPPVITPVSINYDSGEIEILPDQRVYLYFTGTMNDIGPIVNNVDQLSIQNVSLGQIIITQNTFQRPTLLKSTFFNETLNKALESATGITNILESSIFQNRPFDGISNECGGLNIVPTGFKIRQRNEPLRVSIEELLSFAGSRFGCGFAIYYDENDNPRFLLEKDEFFFQNKKILTISNIHNPIQKTINKEILANELTVGFTKFARPNESGTSEGFSTQSEYLIPIEKDEKPIEFLSSLIGDGTEVERVRRNGIENADDQADEKDDDVFVIKIHEFGNAEFYDPSIYGSDDFLNIQRDATNGRIIINGLVIPGIQEDDFINITGATNRQIDGVPVLDYNNNRTILPCSTETQDDIIFNSFNFRQSDDSTPRYTYTPERIEGFNSIDGLLDERTVYNLDHANTQFLLWNFGWFAGALSKKPNTSFIKFLTKKAITTLEKAYDLDTCGLTSDVINERQDFFLNDLRTWNPAIFNEFVYEFECQLSFSDLLILRNALRNRSDEDNDYGFVDFIDNDGELVEAFPMSIKYNPVSLEASFILWGKADES